MELQKIASNRLPVIHLLSLLNSKSDVPILVCFPCLANHPFGRINAHDASLRYSFYFSSQVPRSAAQVEHVVVSFYLDQPEQFFRSRLLD